MDEHLTPEREAEMRRLDAVPTATGGIEDRRLLLAEVDRLRAEIEKLKAPAVVEPDSAPTGAAGSTRSRPRALRRR